VTRVEAVSAAERRRQVYEMRKAGNDWETVARVSGLREGTCKAYLKKAIDEDGMPDFTAIHGKTSELKNTEGALDVIAAAMEPFEEDRYEAVRKAAKNAGFPPKMIAGLILRMKSRYEPVLEEGRRMTVDEMTKSLESKIRLTLGYLDEFNLSQASGKDLAYILGILVDRMQLLSNRPTQIVDVTTRQQLPVLMVDLVAEMQRRGIQVPALPLVERMDGPL
jgi:hypothetical protein